MVNGEWSMVNNIKGESLRQLAERFTLDVQNFFIFDHSRFTIDHSLLTKKTTWIKFAGEY